MCVFLSVCALRVRVRICMLFFGLIEGIAGREKSTATVKTLSFFWRIKNVAYLDCLLGEHASNESMHRNIRL